MSNYAQNKCPVMGLHGQDVIGQLDREAFVVDLAPKLYKPGMESDFDLQKRQAKRAIAAANVMFDTLREWCLAQADERSARRKAVVKPTACANCGQPEGEHGNLCGGFVL
jgi:hypothetical protein